MTDEIQNDDLNMADEPEVADVLDAQVGDEVGPETSTPEIANADVDQVLRTDDGGEA